MWTVQTIGGTAGHVWHFLRRNGKSSLAAVKGAIKAPEPMVHMAIGWLAREGKIDLHREGRSVQLWLTE